MKCRDMAELATRYMEGDLPAGLRLSTRLHLWMCVSCRRYLDQLRRTARFLADGPPPPPPSPIEENRIVDLLAAGRRDGGGSAPG